MRSPPSRSVATCPRCSAGTLAPLTGICELCGYSSRALVAVAPAGSLVGRAREALADEFRLLEPLEEGPARAVFRAEERASGRAVLLTIEARADSGPVADQALRDAMALLGGLDHPHLVPVLRWGVTDGLRWTARAALDARPLRALLAERPLDARTARRVATQLTSALEYLHRRGLVHGAVGAEHVVMDAHGWVHLGEPALPGEGARGDGPAPAPEVERGETPTPAADQFALAALLVEALTGAPAAGAELPRQLADAGVPGPMAVALTRALREDPRDRFASLTDFVWALEHGGPTLTDARPRGRNSGQVMFIKDWSPAPDPARRQRAVRLTVQAVATVIVLGGVAFAVAPLLRPAQPVVTLSPAEATPVAPAPAGPVEEPAPVPVRPTPRGGAAASVRPAPATPTPATPAPAAEPARLVISTDPWGEILIDGRPAGNTPRTDLTLPPGEHLIRVVRDGFMPFERRVTVRSGETLRLTGIALQARAP